MKAIEENKVKALFMAQHLHQKVYCNSNLQDSPYVLSAVDFSTSALLDTGFLQLRDIIDLTNDEAIQVSKLEYGIFECSGVTFKVSKNLKKYKLVHVLKGGEHWHTFEVSIWPLHIVAIQYLLRIGMLLPFTYIDETGAPITLSTEEIIQKGWAKTHNQL